MSNRDLNLAMRISADVSRLMGGLAKGESGLRKFGSAAKGELDALGRFAGSVEGKLAQLGLGVSVAAAGMQSARLDKDLKQLQLTAGATAAEADQLRQSWLEAQIATGQGVEELKAGSNALVAAGLNIKQVEATVRPMAETLAVSTTNADALAKAMGVAAEQFHIDLSNTEQARLLLDKMVVAGRAGNAELENLPDIFARVGSTAKASNLSLDKTLALVETLSKVEPNAERLSTLTDSTLRVFTNANYMKDAQKATGVRFFDTKGTRRDALAVLQDLKSKYDKLDTDAKRFKFISAAFGKADLDTQRGIKTLLDGDSLTKLDKVLGDVRGAAGTVKRDLNDAIGNAVDQTGRLKGALRQAADDFAKPVNDTLSGLIKWGMDSKANGGLGLDGKDMLLGGAGLLVGTAAAGRWGGKAISGIAGKLGGTAAGVATGKALEEAAGVAPVYVVNMPSDGIRGAAGAAADIAGGLINPKSFSKLKTTLALLGGADLSALPMFGAGAMATAAAGVTASGAAGYGVGTLISDYLLTSDGPLGSDFGARLGERIGEGVAHLLAPFSEDARAAIAANRAAAEAERLATAMREGGALILTNSKVFAKEMQAKAELIGQRIGRDNVQAFLAAQPQVTGPLAKSPVMPRNLEDGLQQWTLDKIQASGNNPRLNDLLTGQASRLERQLGQVQNALGAPSGPLAHGAVIPATVSQAVGQQVQDALRSVKPAPAEVKGLIEVRVSNDGRPPLVTRLESAGNVDMKTSYVGRTGAGS